MELFLKLEIMLLYEYILTKLFIFCYKINMVMSILVILYYKFYNLEWNLILLLL